MPKKIQHTTKANLLSIDLPQHGASYTVISHEFIIDYAHQALSAAGFIVLDEEYRCTADGQIAQGIYKLNYNNDPDLAMMFAWTNSYNKQVKFKCVIGAYVNNTGSVMISGDIGSWVRKHTGTADTETQDTIDSYISNAHMYYNQLCCDKAAMETITLNKRKQSQLLGVLFAEYGILTTEQASMIRDQMKKPYHVFTNTDSLWAFYNYVTIALQTSHPKTWMEDQRVLHYFISSINNFAQQQPVTQVQPVVEAEVDPLTTNYGQPENQLNILTEIEKTEAEEPSLELEQNEEYLENPVNLETIDEISNEVIEETVIYTDPMGNTFEALVVPPCAGHDAETEKEIEKETIEVTEDEFAIADNFDLDFNEETNEDVDSIPDFF
jgi:hypothetical protein